MNKMQGQSLKFASFKARGSVLIAGYLEGPEQLLVDLLVRLITMTRSIGIQISRLLPRAPRTRIEQAQ